MGKEKLSYSQRKRNKLDYRREYFKQNPGLFGQIWFCAYCHKALIGRHNVEVDHVMPLNNVLGRNARYNLVAACHDCNRSKSDNVDRRVAVGYLSKIFEVITIAIQNAVVVVVCGCWNLLTLPFRFGLVPSCIACGVYLVVFYTLFLK